MRRIDSGSSRSDPAGECFCVKKISYRRSAATFFDPDLNRPEPAGAVRERGGDLRAAKARGVFVNFDMEQHASRIVTIFAIFREGLGRRRVSRMGRWWGSRFRPICASFGRRSADAGQLGKRGADAVNVRCKGGIRGLRGIIARQTDDWPIPVSITSRRRIANYEEQARVLNRTLRGVSGRRSFSAVTIFRSIAAALAFDEEEELPRGAMWNSVAHRQADRSRKRW